MLSWFPPDRAFSCWASMLLFAAGWAGCCGWASRVAKDARPAEALAYGFALWSVLLPSSATALCLCGIFRPWLFAVSALAPALAGLWFFAGSFAAWRVALSNAVRDPLCCFAVASAAAFLAWGADLNLVYPSTSWDTATYHRPVSVFLLQQGTLGHYPTSNWQANHFARGSEYAAAWIIAVARHEGPSRLMPLFAMLAMAAAIHATLRSWDVPRALAACGAVAATFGVPAAIGSALRDYGDVDLHFAAIAAVATCAISAGAQRERAFEGHALAAVAALALLPGIKSTGLLHAAVLGAVLLATMFIRRAGSAAFWKTIAAGTVVFVAASSSWLAINARDFGNPLFPMPIAIGGTEVLQGFDWIKPGDFDSFLGVPDELRGLGPWERVGASMLSLRIADASQGMHLGGWGHWVLFAGLPVFAAGLVASLARRRWMLALLMAANVAIWVATPHSWWTRLCFPFIAALPLGLAGIAWMLRSGAARNLAATAYLLLAMPSAIVTAQHIWHGRYPAEIALEAASHGRTWAIPQDGFMPQGDPRGLRDAYRWLGNNLPSGARLGHDRTRMDNYALMLLRDDMESTLHEIDAAQSDLAPFDYLAVPASRAAMPAGRGFDGEVVFANQAYTILRRRASSEESPREPARP